MATRRTSGAPAGAGALTEHTIEPDRVVDVRVHGLAPGGDAVGRQQGGAHDGRATFVPLAAPGEDVRARVVREKARVAWAELIELRAPSPVRVPPPCPYFGACGGCQWQHVALDAQRAAKREIAERALGAKVTDLVAPAATGLAYRDRARLVVGGGAVGFRARRSHDVIDIERCLLLGDGAARAFTALRARAAALPLGSEIDLQAGAEGVHVCVRVDRAGERETFSAPEVLGEGGIVGLTLIAGGRSTTVGAADVDVAEPGGEALRIPAGGFAQVGRAANAALVQTVLRATGDGPGDVLELYAGSGNFTRHLLSRSAHVVAHDADAAAVARGRRNAPGATWQLGRPPTISADTVVADPPREGLDGENFTAALGARRRLVYVSCDPQTLGRDANRLRVEGFTLREAIALDLMPQTFHVEVVATFDRG